MSEIEFTHKHGILEKCPESCPAHHWDQKVYPGQAVKIFYQKKEGGPKTFITPQYDQAVLQAPSTSTSVKPGLFKKPFNKDTWYPNAPLTSNEDAFLWYATDNTGQEGDVYRDTSHWRIIDGLSKKNIYEFLKASEKTDIPMLWGYTVDLGGGKMYVKFLTHINPGKQDLAYMGQCIVDLEKKFKKVVVDYDEEDTHTPILESYTPSGNTSGYSTTNFAGKGIPAPPEETQPEEKNSGEIQELKTIKKDILADGKTIYTTYLGEYAPDPEHPFETMVFQPGELGSQTLVTSYAKDEHGALANHYRYVDQYNRAAETEAQPLGEQDHTQIMSYFSDPGILKEADLYPIPLDLHKNREQGLKAMEITPPEGSNHESGERPFMYHYPSNTLFYTSQPCHHINIIPLINQHLKDKGHDYNGSWVTGDITEPELTDRNWIKFIGSDTGQYPESVINYLQKKFGPRDLIYNGQDGWERLPERFIQEG